MSPISSESRRSRMHARSEREVFQEILSYTQDHLTDIFFVRDEGSHFCFIEKRHPSHYVTVDKVPKDSFWVPVNADFDFPRPAGSNNYKDLLKVGKYLVQSFGLKVDW